MIYQMKNGSHIDLSKIVHISEKDMFFDSRSADGVSFIVNMQLMDKPLYFCEDSRNISVAMTHSDLVTAWKQYKTRFCDGRPPEIFEKMYDRNEG